MKMTVFAALTTLFTALFTTAAFAGPIRNQTVRKPAAVAGYENEIVTNFTGGTFLSAKGCKDCSAGSILAVNGSYLRYWQDRIQVGGEGGIRILSKEYSGSSGSETLVDIAAIGAYNFSDDLANSIYAKAGLGLYSIRKANNSGYESAMGLFVGAGKRFAWLPNVSYTPELRLVKKGEIDLGIQIEVLNFSIMW